MSAYAITAGKNCFWSGKGWTKNVIHARLYNSYKNADIIASGLAAPQESEPKVIEVTVTVKEE